MVRAVRHGSLHKILLAVYPVHGFIKVRVGCGQIFSTFLDPNAQNKSIFDLDKFEMEVL